MQQPIRPHVPPPRHTCQQAPVRQVLLHFVPPTCAISHATRQTSYIFYLATCIFLVRLHLSVGGVGYTSICIVRTVHVQLRQGTSC